MRPRIIIPRLRELCPIFAGRVAGAVDFRRAAQSDDYPAPHAFVLLQGITPTGEDLLSQIDQEMALNLTIWLCVPSTADERGQDASEQLISCFVQVRTALLGWTPDVERYTAIMMDGLTLPEGETFTRSRAWAQCDVVSNSLVRDII